MQTEFATKRKMHFEILVKCISCHFDSESQDVVISYSRHPQGMQTPLTVTLRKRFAAATKGNVTLMQRTSQTSSMVASIAKKRVVGLLCNTNVHKRRTRCFYPQTRLASLGHAAGEHA